MALVQGGTLTVALRHTLDGAELELGSLKSFPTGSDRVSVTRLDYLLSEFALVLADGSTQAFTNQFAYVSAAASAQHLVLTPAPTGSFTALRFRVGLAPEINHADPARWAPDHPLNPNVNGLHWSWQGGYVFLALEGNWQPTTGSLGGYSYHLATERSQIRVEVPLRLDLTSDAELELVLDVRRILSGPHQIRINGENTSTHSRDKDPLAQQLVENLRQAFRIGPIRTAKAPSATPGVPQVLAMAAGATPYRLSISRFFPQPDLPRDNPLTEEGVALGRRLFEDPILSGNNRQSCASCHHATHAYSEPQRFSLGSEGQLGTRNAMPLFNLAWKKTFFWDGRAPRLRDQVLLPIEDPREMHDTLSHVVAKLETRPAYQELFARAFGTPQINAHRLALALEQFLLTQIAHRSKFDRSLSGKAELNDEEKRGFELFHTEYDPRRQQFGADCFHCHGGPLFQSQSFANNGLDSEFTDPGRSRVTGRPADAGRFAVPSLRNIAITAPYMHDGRFATLEEVVDHYAGGLKRSATLDPNLAKHPDGGLPLPAADRRALVAFLKTLTDE